MPLDEVCVSDIHGLARVRLDQVERAGPAAARRRVDHDDGLVSVEQGVGEVEPPDAKIRHPNLRGQFAFQKPPDNLDAEGVVAQEDIADAGDQNAMSRQASAGARSREHHFVLGRIVPPRAVTGLMP
jgi:hypothetical protein